MHENQRNSHVPSLDSDQQFSRRYSPNRPAALNALCESPRTPRQPYGKYGHTAMSSDVLPPRRILVKPETSFRTEIILASLGTLCLLAYFVMISTDEAGGEMSAIHDGEHYGASSILSETSLARVAKLRQYAQAHPAVPAFTVNKSFFPHWSATKCEKPNQPGQGMLPSILLLGVHKGGSTALFSYLVAHENIFPSYCKETHFFDWKYPQLQTLFQHRNSDALTRTRVIRSAYATFFPPNPSSQVSHSRHISIEGTPSYFFGANGLAARAKEIVPKAKLIVALRNPVDRSISHFIGKSQSEFATFGTCTQWFDATKVLVSKCDSLRPSALGLGGVFDPLTNVQIMAAWSSYTQCVLAQDNAVGRSIYSAQLFQWLQHYPQNQIYVLFSEKLFGDPNSEMDRLTQWLSLRRHTDKERHKFVHVGSENMKKFNLQFMTSSLSQKQEISREKYNCDKREMSLFFQPYEADLFDLLVSYFPKGQFNQGTPWKSPESSSRLNT
eukprot:m.203012 g.203012  ORF g.203012 m.203012 type:complete len:498 (-) comp32844_c0_seq3:40-1533(-)